MSNPVRDIEAFLAGRKEKGLEYLYFVPELVNVQWQWKDVQLGVLLEKASISLGELNSYARLVPNTELFIQLHVTKEAVISSRIEGTQTQLDEALLPEEEVLPERRNDWLEVRNYMAAMNGAIQQLEHLPLSSRLLRQAHELLLSGVRGQHRQPGEFRRSQNWIGGSSLKDAAFIPPAHHYIDPLMGDLENFLHNREIVVPSLVRIGIAHYQFETIHPFLDGNGRIGRLLITLYLVSEKILHKPLLYLSSFFEKNRMLYYENLTRVREKNDLLHWLKYFLVGVDETARKAAQTLSEVLVLKQDTERHLTESSGRRAKTALTLLSHLFVNPVVTVKQVQQICGLSAKSANDLVTFFHDEGILKEVSGQTRYRIFAFSEYLDKFE
ncbi:Fic family protein [Chlorobaculum sp. 24CR]|uniref:Fic family protein n=1 Tax=Chlorobaculum sp. 24CR TaxID=2508878 RepID=UPI00100C2C52|nr:Fic family protein [Chlorobaculum sp. 24CR]RXK87732.1 Fic family protein [Chlorobaculum sp. 24CR]